MTDKRVVTDEEAAEARVVADERMAAPFFADEPWWSARFTSALLDTRERCIEVLERLAAPSRSFGYDQDAGCQARMSIAATLLRELHGEGEDA